MNGYGGLLVGQMLGALAVLALAGGWALWPFRRADRPYLWLAAPLAGLLILACGLVLGYVACRLTVSVSLALALGLLCPPTVWRLLRRERPLALPPGLGTALLVLAAVAVWATAICNHTAIRQRGPTICQRYGTDAIGYSQVGDWILRHPHSKPLYSPVVPGQAYVFLELDHDPRFGSFLLTAAAAHVRGTSSLFSYDWLCGVGLAAGLLALAGAYASDRRGLLLLLAAGGISLWFHFTRSGYLGKSVAYPGCVLLAGVFLATWARPAPGRLLTTALLGAGVGLCHNPLTTVGVLGAVFAATVAAALAVGVFSWSRPEFSGSCASWYRPLVGLLVYGLATAPILYLCRFLCPHPLLSVQVFPGLGWSKIWPVAFDLDSHALLLVLKGQPMHWLLVPVVALNAVLLGLALRCRHVEAAAFLLCTGVVLGGWLTQHHAEVFQFQGLLFPFTVVGAVALAQRLRELSWPRSWPWAALAMAGSLIVARMPQFAQSWQNYVAPTTAPDRVVCSQADIEEIVRRVGDRTVDVLAGPGFPSLLLLTELTTRGVRAQFREGSWRETVSYTGWKAPQYPTGDFLLACGRGWCSTADVLFRSRHFCLCSNNKALAFGGLRPSHQLELDREGAPCFWQGNQDSEIQLWNGTGRVQYVTFAAEAQFGGGNPDFSSRTLRYALDDAPPRQVVGHSSPWQLRIPLTLPPGRHRLLLSVTDVCTGTPVPENVRDLLLLLAKLRLEPACSSSPGMLLPQAGSVE
jgi:hypothetical protein